MVKYLIIGNSAGGIGAAEGIREIDKTGSLTMISEEEYPAYSRPMISNYLAGECDIDGMLYRNEDFYVSNNIALMTGQRVGSLNLLDNLAILANGDRISFENLLLATGGKPVLPDIGRKKGIHTFTSLADAKEIAGKLAHVKTAVVIGGGLIGVSATEALVKRGVQVTVVELRDRLLSLLLDEEASHRLEQKMQEAGVRIVGNNSPVEVLGRAGDEATVGGVRLSDGTELGADLIIMAVGVAPRAELAEMAGIKIGRGILVDRFMGTSAKGVYACGDAAEAYDYLLESNRQIPIWPLAYSGGRVAGFNMAGRQVEYSGGTSMNSMNYFGLPVCSIGIVNPEESGDRSSQNSSVDVAAVGSRYETHVSRANGNYRKLVFSKEDGASRLVGLVMMGNIQRGGLYHQLIRERTPVDPFKDVLKDHNLNYGFFLK